MISRSCFRIRISNELQCERSHLFSSPPTCTFTSQSIFNRTQTILLMCAILACAPGHQKPPHRKAGGNQATLGEKKCRNTLTRILWFKVLEGEHCFDLTVPLYALLPAYLDSWLSAALPPLLSLRARTSLHRAYNPTIISLTIVYETSAIVDILMDTLSFSPQYPNFTSTSKTRTLRVQIPTDSNQQPVNHRISNVSGLIPSSFWTRMASPSIIPCK